MAQKLKPGDIVALIGDIGTGRPLLQNRLPRDLGSQMITSPTFGVQEYMSGRIPLYHFDVYRLNSEEEMYELGYEEYFW